jgi:hypothetical protein
MRALAFIVTWPRSAPFTTSISAGTGFWGAPVIAVPDAIRLATEQVQVKYVYTTMKTELLRFLLVTALILSAPEAFAFQDAGNRPYVQSGPSGIFYARCIPETNNGPAGVTEVYRVSKEGDHLVDRYEWFTKHGVVLGWSPIAGKVALLAIRKDEPVAPDKQVEISICLGGKLLKSWTTAEFQSLGAKVERSHYGGERAVFTVAGCEQIPGTNEYIFVVSFGDKKVSLDVLTGNEYRK